jgi:hypothetical protein
VLLVGAVVMLAIFQGCLPVRARVGLLGPKVLFPHSCFTSRGGGFQACGWKLCENVRGVRSVKL